MIIHLCFAIFVLVIPVICSQNAPKNRKARSPLEEVRMSTSAYAKAIADRSAITEAVKEKISLEPDIRGIHLTSWGAGSMKTRKQILEKISESVINAVVVAVKETDGKVYIPGVEKAHNYGSYVPAISKPEHMIEDFKKACLYKIARIVVFKDNHLPKHRLELAVKTPEGNVWKSFNGGTWVDPYNREIWEYNIDIAVRCAELGFDEIQFDYIRFPSEGVISMCRYSRPHTEQSGIENLGEFLKYAAKKLKPYKVKISAAIFGLTTTIKHGMGIGQNIETLARHADYIYPMMYPSHYEKGNYGIKNPDAKPFKTIDYGLRDAFERLGEDYAKMRPYLQDFSLGLRYGPHEIRAQMIAAKRNMLKNWILWNPSNRYTWDALTPRSYYGYVCPKGP
ncbi:MAG: putative glycoside hydrolase [Elusimicrobia bacterium]|nr:putative glycoside hydrolase [Elusimicrobiota bacterium]